MATTEAAVGEAAGGIITLVGGAAAAGVEGMGEAADEEGELIQPCPRIHSFCSMISNVYFCFFSTLSRSL